MLVDEIREEITRGFSGRIEELCLFIVNILIQKPADQVERLSFNTFARWTDTTPSNPVLHTALAALCQIDHRPLEPYFIFWDEREDREVELDLQYIKQALSDGLFINPETGDAIDNFQKLVIPMFRATDDFKEVIGGGR